MKSNDHIILKSHQICYVTHKQISIILKAYLFLKLKKKKWFHYLQGCLRQRDPGVFSLMRKAARKHLYAYLLSSSFSSGSGGEGVGGGVLGWGSCASQQSRWWTCLKEEHFRKHSAPHCQGVFQNCMQGSSQSGSSEPEENARSYFKNPKNSRL